MWLLTGPFDSKLGDVTTTKTKLLKTGRKIALGRKEKPLVVNSKKISRDHCEFSVGPCTEDDVSNPDFVPTLQLYNAKDKTMSIERDGQMVVVNPLSTHELMSGDKITIVVGVSVMVQWRRIVCFLPPARSLPSISNQDCAALGICLITSPNTLATHHLTPKYELSVPLATSLLSTTQLVKVEWLQELIRLGTVSDGDHPFKLVPLEQSYVPPSESKYRPIFSPSLPSALKSFKFWEPNEERLHFFKGYRFVLLSNAEGQADAETRELVIRGDGEYECFPLSSGEAKWRQLLAKAKRKVDEVGLKVVIVAREPAVQAAVGPDRWQEMISEAQSMSLPLVNVDLLINAVINTDVSLVNQGSPSRDPSEQSESLPDFIPNTHPSEPSLSVAQEKAPAELNSVNKSKSPSPPPTLFDLAIPPPPSKTLIRRAKPTGRAEKPVVSDTKDETQVDGIGYNIRLPSLRTRTSALKRRTPGPPPVEEPVEQGEEPPLKKFKALFDASDPDKMNVDPQSVHGAFDIATGDSIGVTDSGGSFTQSESRPPHSQRIVPPRTLDAVAEEEEESQTQGVVAAPAQSRVRAKTPLPQATQNPRGNEGSGTNDKPSSKQTKSKQVQGHKVDTDPAFLLALASRKGKRSGEDEFDREFNKLRISRPDIHREEEDRPWEILGDFDTEVTNLRGNFMVVIELEPYRRSAAHGDNGPRRTYDGLPNFKKFRKAPTPSSCVPIELVARGEHDYGMGSGYWKDGSAYTQETQAPTQGTGTRKRRAPTVLESDDGNSDVPVAKPVKKPTRKTAPSKPSKAAEKLFLNSDEEDSMPLEHLDQSQTAENDPRPSLRNKGSKRRHIVVDDDSDDGVAFKGFGKKRRVR